MKKPPIFRFVKCNSANGTLVAQQRGEMSYSVSQRLTSQHPHNSGTFYASHRKNGRSLQLSSRNFLTMNTRGAIKVLRDSVESNDWQQILHAIPPEYQFLSNHWYNVWSSHYASNDSEISTAVFSAANSETDNSFRRWEGIFPFITRVRHGIKILSMAGYYYPFRTFPCHPEGKDAAIRNFVDLVHNDTGTHIVQLGRLQSSDNICDPLQTSFTDKKWKVFKVPAGAQQIVKLPPSIEEFRSTLSRNLKKNHDRRKRNLEAMDGFEIAHYNNCSTADRNHAINQCADVESRCWLAAEGQNTRIYGREQFWKAYASNEDGSNRLLIWILRLDSKPIAYSLALDSGNCRYSISGQYDMEYKKLGVGVIADMLMFQQAIESRINVVNMGEGEFDYKQRWGATPGSTLQSYYIFRPGIVGLSIYATFRTVNHLRKTRAFSWLNRFF